MKAKSSGHSLDRHLEDGMEDVCSKLHVTSDFYGGGETEQATACESEGIIGHMLSLSDCGELGGARNLCCTESALRVMRRNLSDSREVDLMKHTPR